MLQIVRRMSRQRSSGGSLLLLLLALLQATAAVPSFGSAQRHGSVGQGLGTPGSRATDVHRVLDGSGRRRLQDASAEVKGGGPDEREVGRQRGLNRNQADEAASKVMLEQQARVDDTSTKGAKRRGPQGTRGKKRPAPRAGGGGGPAPGAKTRSGPALCGNNKCDSGETCATCPRDCKQANGKPCRRVGIQYSVWHMPAWNAMRVRQETYGGPPLSIETVLRSQVPGGRNMSFADLLYAPGLNDLGMNFHWQHLPADATGGGAAPYCIYHRRKKGDVNFNPYHEASYQGFYGQPDCEGYGATLARHARQLVAAGVDHVIVDMTNLAFYSPTADAIQLRPLEVLVEEWSALRAQGIQTPDIAAWQRMPDRGLPPADVEPDKVMWKYVLRLYNTRAYQHMWLRDPETGKKIFVYPDVPGTEPAFVTAVEKNWGMNNIVAQPMWISHDDEWAFMSLCDALGFIDNAPCNQSHSRQAAGKGVAGTQLAVSPSYQLSFSSAAFAAAGSWMGHTFRKQFQTAFEVKPQWLFLSSWNEHVAQPVPGAVGKAMGFSADPSIGMFGFVDTYAAAFSRDIEPTVEDGSLLYDILASCLRVYRSSGGTCDGQPDELCCSGGQWSDSFAYLTLNGLILGLYSDTVKPDAGRTPLYNCTSGPRLSASAAARQERAAARAAEFKAVVLNAGGGGRQLLAGAGGKAKGKDKAARGSRGTSATKKQKLSAPAVKPAGVLVGATPWFLSTDAKCEGSGMAATRIASISTWKGRDFLRTLTRCVGLGGDRTQYTMGNGCVLDSYKPEKALGYVR